MFRDVFQIISYIFFRITLKNGYVIISYMCIEIYIKTFWGSGAMTFGEMRNSNTNQVRVWRKGKEPIKKVGGAGWRNEGKEGGDQRGRWWGGDHVALSEDPNVGLNVGVGRCWFAQAACASSCFLLFTSDLALRCHSHSLSLHLPLPLSLFSSRTQLTPFD